MIESARVYEEDVVRLGVCVGDALDQAAQTFGAAEGWVFEATRVSFASMRRAVDEVARGMLGLGLQRGDVVATWMPNRYEFAVLQMASAKIGTILAPLNTRFRSEEVHYILEHSEARMLVYTPRFLSYDYRSMFEQAAGSVESDSSGRVRAARLPALTRVVELDDAEATWALGWDSLVDAGADVDTDRLAAVQRAQRPEQPLMLQYTSGTTAFPKGALLNHTLVLNYGTQMYTRMGVRRGETVVNTQPFYHSGGACGALPVPLTIGCCMVIPEYYEAEHILALIEREHAVARTGFAAMYIAELAHPQFDRYDLSSLRAGWIVGPREVIERVRSQMKLELIQIYGSTEGGGTAGTVSDSWERRASSQGRAFRGTEIQIRDPEDSRPLPAGDIGEIWTRGWCQMSGYLNQPLETAAVSDDDGWIASGDLGSVDAQGYLHFAGRIKDMLKPGGENVSAEEIEAYLMRHESVQQVAVIGIPDERLGEAVTAVVEARAGHSLTEADVVAFCRGRIANYKVPQHVVFTTDWPLTGSGKIQKAVLRERYATLAGTPADGAVALGNGGRT